jgi:hypothetical protein
MKLLWIIDVSRCNIYLEWIIQAFPVTNSAWVQKIEEEEVVVVVVVVIVVVQNIQHEISHYM